MSRILALLLLAFGLAACEKQLIHPEFSATCRLVRAALYPDSPDMREVGQFALPGAVPGIKLVYRVSEDGSHFETHDLICRFAGEDSSAERANLVAVIHNNLPLSDTKLTIMKRWWLNDAVAQREAEKLQHEEMGGLIDLPPAVGYGLQQSLNGLALSSIYGLCALALALIYGLTGRIFLSFGEVMMIGGYGALSVIVAGLLALHLPIGLTLVAGLTVAMIGGAALSYALGRLVVRPILKQSQAGQPVLVATLACGIVLTELARLLEGPDARWIPALGTEPVPLAKAGSFLVTITANQMMSVTLALLTGLSALFMLHNSPFGRAWRAMSDEPVMTGLLGIDPRAILLGAFSMAGMLAGVAGFIHTFHYGTMHYGIALGLGLKALVGAILGGIGSLRGAFLGGLLLGLIEAATSAVLPIGWKEFIIYGLVIFILQVKPGGLFGYGDLKPRLV